MSSFILSVCMPFFFLFYFTDKDLCTLSSDGDNWHLSMSPILWERHVINIQDDVSCMLLCSPPPGWRSRFSMFSVLRELVCVWLIGWLKSWVDFECCHILLLHLRDDHMIFSCYVVKYINWRILSSTYSKPHLALIYY